MHDNFINPLTRTVAIMSTAIKHAVPDRVKPSFEIFDIRALRRYPITRMVTVGVKGLNYWREPSTIQYTRQSLEDC